MGEDAVVRRHATPVTQRALEEELRALGVEAGMTLLVHASLSALGWVAGGAQAVVQALQAVLGAPGTLMMPTFSTHLSDPAEWQHPPVPEQWWPIVRAETPAYDPVLTPTRQMGAVVDCFRAQPEVQRSAHPHVSFGARGPQAAALTGRHALSFSLGEGSPLARLYELDGWVLLLGVGHGNNSSLHLAEARASFAGKRVVQDGAPLQVAGERRWVSFDNLAWDDDDFGALGAAWDATGNTRAGRVGHATARLMRQRPLVDFALRWLESHRHATAP